MNTISHKQVIVGLILLAIFISIPLTISMLSQEQQNRSNAAASTSLSFTPGSTTTAPIQTKVGGTINLDLYVNPGNNDVSFVKYIVNFDPTKVQLVTTDPVDLNKTVFTSVEGPVISSGTIAQSVSIGSDPTKVVTQNTNVGTIHFIAIGSTNGGTTSVTFSSTTEALSAGPSEQASENVLSTTSPAILSISGSSTPSATATPQPLPSVTGTSLDFTLLLDGVGAAGDDANPTGNSLSNKNPLHPQRNLDVQVFNTNNNVVASTSAPIEYDASSGDFLGDIGLPASVATGNYYVKVQTDRYLRRLMPGIIQVITGQQTKVPVINLISGDTNTDNVLNILDYNALLDCGYGEISPLPMNDPNSTFNSKACQVHQPADDVDLNDDGVINSTDYNLFLRELSVQNGD